MCSFCLWSSRWSSSVPLWNSSLKKLLGSPVWAGCSCLNRCWWIMCTFRMAVHLPAWLHGRPEVSHYRALLGCRKIRNLRFRLAQGIGGLLRAPWRLSKLVRWLWTYGVYRIWLPRHSDHMIEKDRAYLGPARHMQQQSCKRLKNILVSVFWVTGLFFTFWLWTGLIRTNHLWIALEISSREVVPKF